MNTIFVQQEINNNKAISTDDGICIFNLIKALLSENNDVIVDFSNIELMTTTFLNAAIGQLYGPFNKETIQKHLRIENMENDDMEILNLVTRQSQQYFSNKNDSSALFTDESGDRND